MTDIGFESGTFTDPTQAARFRDIINTIVENKVKAMQPETRTGMILDIYPGGAVFNSELTVDSTSIPRTADNPFRTFVARVRLDDKYEGQIIEARIDPNFIPIFRKADFFDENNPAGLGTMVDRSGRYITVGVTDGDLGPLNDAYPSLSGTTMLAPQVAPRVAIRGTAGAWRVAELIRGVLAVTTQPDTLMIGPDYASFDTETLTWGGTIAFARGSLVKSYEITSSTSIVTYGGDPLTIPPGEPVEITLGQRSGSMYLNFSATDNVPVLVWVESGSDVPIPPEWYLVFARINQGSLSSKLIFASQTDFRSPAAPTGLILNYVKSGYEKVALIASWNPVTIATNGDPVLVGGYELWGRPDGEDWRRITTTNDVTITSVNFDSDTEWNFKVRAMGANGIPGVFSSVGVVEFPEETEVLGNQTYWQPAKPAVGKPGDEWFDTDDGNAHYVFTESANDYVLTPFGSGALDNTVISAINGAISSAATANAAAATAQTTADGKGRNIYANSSTISTFAPYRTTDIWWDLTDSANIAIKRWNGTAWVAVQVGSSGLATAVTNDIASKIDAAYVLSRGTDLVTNGTALLGTNYNFSEFTIDKTDTPIGGGSFDTPVGSTTARLNDEFIAVDTVRKYILRLQAKQKGTSVVGKVYTGLAPYDVDKLSISPYMYMFQAGTTTTLASALNPGATKVILTSSASWNNAAGASTHLRSLTFWNWTDGQGKVWGPETYTRSYYGNVYDDGAISGNEITLRVPWAGPAIPAGTSVSNGSSGGTYMYTALNNTVIPQSWTQYESATPIGGVHTNKQVTATTAFPPGTAFVKLVFLSNRLDNNGASDTNSKHSFAAISFSDTNAAAKAAETAQTTADGKGRNYWQGTAPTGGTYTSYDTWFNTSDGNKVNRWNGTAWVLAELGTNALANNAVSTAKIVDSAISDAKVATNAITNGKILDGAVGSSKVADAAIVSAKINDAAVVSAKIADAAIVNAKIADLAVTGAKIANATIVNANIVDGTIQNAKIGNLDAGKLTTGSLDAARIAAGSIVAAKLATGTITAASGVIADAAILTAKIADLAVTNGKIADLAITNAKIADATIASAKIAALDAAKITTGTLDAARIAAGSIQAEKLLLVGSNMIPDPTLQTTAAWYIPASATRSATGGWAGDGIITFPASATTQDAGSQSTVVDNRRPYCIPVTPGLSYYATARVKPVGGTTVASSLYVGFIWLDSTGTAIGFSDLGSPAMAGVADGVWSQVTASKTAPAGAVWARVFLRSMSTQTTSTVWSTPTMIQMASAELIVDGAITAPKIVAGAIQAGSAIIADGAIANAKISDLDAVKINAGTLDAARIAAGSISANKLEAILLLASQIVAGDALGTHTRMSPSGFTGWAADPTDEVVKTFMRLNGAGLGFGFDANNPKALIGGDGFASMQSLSTDHLIVNGLNIGEMLKRISQGVTAYTVRETPIDSITTTETSLIELRAVLKPGRLYSLTSAGVAGRSSVAGDVSEWAMRVAYDGAAVSTSSTAIRASVRQPLGPATVYITLPPIFVFINTDGNTADREARFLLTVKRFSGTGNVGVWGSSSQPATLTLRDEGPYTPPVDARTKFVTTWKASSAWQHNFDSGSTTIASGAEWYNVRGPSSDGGQYEKWAQFAFTGNSIEGESSVTIATALSGATLTKAEAYFKLNYASNGIALLKPSFRISPTTNTASNSTLPGTAVASDGVMPATGIWVDITSLFTASMRGFYTSMGTVGNRPGSARGYWDDLNGDPVQLRLSYLR